MKAREEELNPPRRDSVVLWTSIVLGPIAFAADLQARYAMVHWACANGRDSLLLVPTVIALTLALASAAIGARARRKARRDAFEGELVPLQSRREFMAMVGIGFSLLMALLIVAQAIPSFVLSACDG